MDFNKIRILSTMCLFIMYADIVLIMHLYDEYFKLWICFCYCSSLIISEKSYWNQHILYIFGGEISMLCKPNHTRFSLMSRYKTQHLKHIYTLNTHINTYRETQIFVWVNWHHNIKQQNILSYKKYVWIHNGCAIIQIGSWDLPHNNRKTFSVQLRQTKGNVKIEIYNFGMVLG